MTLQPKSLPPFLSYGQAKMPISHFKSRKEDKEKIKQPGCGSEGKEKSYMQQNCDSRENQKKMLVQGRLLLKKKAKDGMTLAIAEREWSVRFDET